MMATSLAAQLAQIAAKSKSSLDVKAQKAAHAKSLIFEPRIAASQSFQIVYATCIEGFDELCILDGRFTHFGSTLFSEQSKTEDRTQMTAAENAELDRRIESFLRLVGRRLTLMPAIKALEWLIRRFRIHEYSTASLLAAVLPYHTSAIFRTIMSILPAKLPHEFRFLDPYVRSLTSPPRAIIVQQATQNSSFLSTISEFTLSSCRLNQHYTALVTFWAGILTEATNGLLDKNRTGRRAIQAGHDQDLMHHLGPILSDALAMKEAPEAQIAGYMATAILAAKGGLADGALSAFMEQIVHGWTPETLQPGLFCIAILAHYRSSKQIPGKVTRGILRIQNPLKVISEIAGTQPVDKLLYGLALSLVDRLAKKGDAETLPLLQAIILSGLMSDQQASLTFKTLLVAAHRVTGAAAEGDDLRKLLSHSLSSLTQAGGYGGEVIRAAVKDVDVDLDALELSLGTPLRSKRAEIQAGDDVDMAAPNPAVSIGLPAKNALEQLPAWTATTSSCLLHGVTSPFDEICAVFLAVASDAGLLRQLDEAPALRRLTATTDPFYFTFYMRLWCGPYPRLAKVTALEQVAARIKEVDVQALIPYCLSALGDDARRVRSASATLLAGIASLYTGNNDTKRNIWGSNGLYDRPKDVRWMDWKTSVTLLHNILLPTLDESVMQQGHASTSLGTALNSNSNRTGGVPDITRSTRLQILTFLASHVVETPLLAVAVRLLEILNHVRSVSDTTRTELLLPWLRRWASLSPEMASQSAVQQNLEEKSIDDIGVRIVLPNEQEGLAFFLDFIKTSGSRSRQTLVRAVFQRLQGMWPSMKSHLRLMTAKALLAVSLLPSSESFASLDAAELLRNLDLSTDILGSFLKELQSAARAVVELPSSKRRRIGTSDHSKSSGTTSTGADVGATLRLHTFVLELVQGSKLVEHPELFQILFITLSDLQHLRAVVGADLGYLQNLVLSSLIAMMPAYDADKSPKIDTAVDHGDVLVACLQKSASPAVQNAALLLVATLARTAPDVVLHSVMPIFTFMGTSILRQGDEYSAHVIHQTIKDVVPPLVDTFRKSRRNIVASAVDLLSSFVIAYEHIPSHRKHELFLSLVNNLGADEFLFALLAMFVDKYDTPVPLVAFLAGIMESFAVEIQLQTLARFLDLVRDIFKPKPGLSAVILGRYEDKGGKNLAKIALKELILLPALLNSRRLQTDVRKLARQDDMDSARMRDLYNSLLESTLTLTDEVTSNKLLRKASDDILFSLLNLLSVADFVRTVESLLDRSKSGLRTRVLQAVRSRIEAEDGSNAESRVALLAFLPHLTADIREVGDISYKVTAVNCVDKIAEKYGKKDVEAVAAAAETIAGPHCLAQGDERLQVMALLCLASLTDILQDAMVSILPTAVPQALICLRTSLRPDAFDRKMHNAALALITALAQHLAFMLSEAHLNEILAACNMSAELAIQEDAVAQRKECLNFLVKRVDAKLMFLALERTFAEAVKAGPRVSPHSISQSGIYNQGTSR
jgi:U3 small nucleolar RNA-associated protein 10